MNFGASFSPVSFFTVVPPFPSTAADNGLSVDGVSGQIVLGNNVGDATRPAALVSAREIVTNASGVALDIGIITNAIQTLLNGNRVLITGGNFTTPFLNILSGNFGASTITLQSGDDGQSSLNINTGVNGLATLQVQHDADNFTITADSSGFITFSVSGTNMWRISTTTFFSQIGPPLTTANGATLQVSGTLTCRRVVTGVGAGTTNINRDLDSNKVFLSSAAANLALPVMTAGNLRLGFIVRLAVNDAAGGTITAAAGQTIRFGALFSTAGGTISSVDVGAYISIVLVNSTTWVTESFTGAWVLT